jgi:hypothetical protein
MTYQRVLSRNRLGSGGYDEAPPEWQIRVPLEGGHVPEISEDEAFLLRREVIAERLRSYEGAARMLLGDLRRLEQDTLDEGTTCRVIAGRTGLDPDTVAAVLKEFLGW